jgi:hypothetical protein
VGRFWVCHEACPTGRDISAFNGRSGDVEGLEFGTVPDGFHLFMVEKYGKLGLKVYNGPFVRFIFCFS